MQAEVLIVDDDPTVRDISVTGLELFGFDVLSAEDGEAAIEIFRDHGQIDLVILDLTLPGLSAGALVSALDEIRAVPIVVSSGYPEHDAMRHFPNNRPTRFIQKPYEPSLLVDLVREVLEGA